MNLLPLFSVLVYMTSLQASAQEIPSGEPQSRTALIEDQRRKKAQQLKPDAPGRVESGFKTAQDYGDLIWGAPPAGIRPKLSSAAPGWGGLVLGSGFSLGPEYYRPDLAKGEVVFRSSAIGTLKGNYLFDTQLTFPRAAGNRMVFDFLGRYKAERSIEFYGLGPDSQRENRTNYSRESSELNFGVAWKPLPRSVQVGATAGLLLVNVGPGVAGGIASTDEVFGPTAAPGIQEQTNFVKAGPYLEYDTRDIPTLAKKGRRVRVGYEHYQDYKREAYSFGRFHLLMEQFVPFLNEKRVVALRARTDLSHVNGDQTVPFYLHPTLGGPDDLRGFRLFRFTDSNSLAVNLEYRQEISPAIEMAIFGDGGKVFQRPGQLNFGDLEGSGGFGFRFRSRSSVVMRLDLGFSNEGHQIWFRFSGIY